MSTAETASKHWTRTHESVNNMCGKHASTLGSLARNLSVSNEQHGCEIDAIRAAAEQDVVNSSEDVVLHVDGISERQKGDASCIVSVIKSQIDELDVLRESHSGEAASVEKEAQETFQRRYMDYEPTGSTPVKCEPDIPSKGAIDSLRAMPIETLQEEFRENHPYESTDEKQSMPSLIPRSPLTEVN